MLLMAAGGLLVVLVCVDMGIKQYIEENFEEEEVTGDNSGQSCSSGRFIIKASV